MRVLHLVDSGFRGQNRWASAWQPADLEMRACALVQERLNVKQHTLLLGPADAAERAGRLGMRVDAALCPPLGRPELAWRTLRRTIAVAEADIVQCWNRQSARLAALASCAQPMRIEPAPHCIPITPATPTPAERHDARQALGIDDNAVMIILLGRGTDADALRFVYVLSALRFVGIATVGVVPSWAAQLGRALRYGRRLTPRVRFIVNDAPTSSVLPAADFGLWAADGCDDLPSAWFVAEAHARGIPVVASRHAGAGEIYDSYAAGACLAHSHAPPELARILMSLADDGAHRRQLADSVYRHYASLHGAERFIRRMAAAWNLGSANLHPVRLHRHSARVA